MLYRKTSDQQRMLGFLLPRKSELVLIFDSLDVLTLSGSIKSLRILVGSGLPGNALEDTGWISDHY